jgi:hypothetical protein
MSQLKEMLPNQLNFKFLNKLVKNESSRRRYSDEYRHLMDTYDIDIDKTGENE